MCSFGGKVVVYDGKNRKYKNNFLLKIFQGNQFLFWGFNIELNTNDYDCSRHSRP